MSHWPECSVAAESRGGEVASIFRGDRAKNRQSSMLRRTGGVELTSVSGCFFNLFGV
ncbi:TPA: hypothetical protein HH703_005090 [Escherichia coli]|nr:hypothetical protein [Escherichia coli]